MKVYKWKAQSNDGAFDDHSKQNFETEEQAYEDMREAVLEKMKWNTTYRDDLNELEENDCIHYDVDFQRNKIVHTSFSGIYTYEIYTEEVQYCLVSVDEDFLTDIKVFKNPEEAINELSKIAESLEKEFQTEGRHFDSKFGYPAFTIYKNRSYRGVYIIEGKMQ